MKQLSLQLSLTTTTTNHSHSTSNTSAGTSDASAKFWAQGVPAFSHQANTAKTLKDLTTTQYYMALPNCKHLNWRKHGNKGTSKLIRQLQQTSHTLLDTAARKSVTNAYHTNEWILPLASYMNGNHHSS